jgi:alpha-L-fucosidase
VGGGEQTKFVHKWEECRGISQSFGYNWQDTESNVLSTDELIKMFVKIVSENGNLLLIVNLDVKGGLPAVQEKRLKAMGKWLEVNGEAIYATKPWLVSHEGDNIWFTQSKDGKNVYAICTQWPENELVIKSVYLDNGAKVTMLGTDRKLEWKRRGFKNKLVIKIPDSLKSEKPCEHAYVFKMEL